jgi:hypothetical protein
MAGLIYPIAYKVDSSGLKKAESEFKQFSKGLKTVLGAVGIGYGIKEVVNQLNAAGKAAAEDVKSQALLANQLRNTVGATNDQVAAVEKSIAKMQLQSAVADDEIRPAFAALTRATGDVTEATKLTSLALDISAGTGKNLSTVALALGKAVNGSTTSLQKLVPSIKGAKDPMGLLAKEFKGASEAAARNDPYQRLNIIMQDLQESVGMHLLPYLNKFADYLSSSAGQKNLADFSSSIGDAVNAMGNLGTAISNLAPIANPVFNALNTLLAALAGNSEQVAKNLIPILGFIPGYTSGVNARKSSNQTSTNRLAGQMNPASGGLYTTLTMQQTTATNALSAAQSAASAKATAAAKAAAAALAAQKKAIDAFKTSIQDLAAGLKPLADAGREIGQFEQTSIDAIDALTSKIKDALANKTITDFAASVLNTYVTTEGKALAAIGAQRDALAAKRGLAETLIADVKSAVMGFGDITGLLKTTTETVVETQNVIINGIATTISKSVEKVSTNDIVAEYQKIIDKTKAFAKNLKVLKDAGLNQNLFKQIVDAGVDAGGATAEAIIAGGGSTITELNSLFTDLQDTGSTIAEQTAVVMYGAGVDLTNGLIEGMKSQEAALLAQAQKMADEIAATIANMLANIENMKAVSAGYSQSDLTFSAIDQAMALSGATSFTGENRQFALAGMNSGAINVTVNAGLGTNGASVAKDIVTTIKAYERTNGAVWSPA